jgi:hypothetical protein
MAGVKVVHLLRDPKKVIDSLVKVQVFEERKRYGLYVDFAYYHVPAMHREDTPQKRAARFYVEWNRMIEPYADFSWQVEGDVRVLLDRLGIEHRGRDVFNDTAYNGRGGPTSDVQPEDFGGYLRRDLREIVWDYGYEWPGL